MTAHSCSGLPAAARSAKVGALVFGCWGALAVLAAQERPPVSAMGTGLIAGRVVDVTSGQPIAGTTVSLRRDGVRIAARIDAAGRVEEGTRTPNPSVVTDSQGRFVFGALPAGSYSVMPQRDDYTPVGSAYVELVDADRKLDVPLVMGRRGSIAGTVRDDVGQPMVGALVLAFQKRFLASPFLMQRGGVVTDDHGRYRVSNLMVGDYLVCVCGSQAPVFDLALLTVLTPPTLTADGLASYADRTMRTIRPTFYPDRTKVSEASFIAVDFADGRTGIDISVTPVRVHRISGRILGGGRDAQGALRVSLLGAGDLPEAVALTEHNAVPASDGQFELAGVPPGDYTLQAFFEKPVPNEPRLWVSHPISVGDDDVIGVEVALRAGVTVRGRVEYVGRVVRPTPQIVAKTYIGLSPVDLTPAVLSAAGSTGRVGYPATVRADGSFQMDDVIPGRYLIQGGTVPPEWQSIGSVSAEGQFLRDTVITVGETGLGHVLVTVVDTPLATVEGNVALRPYDLPREFFACVFPADRALWSEPFRNPSRFVCQALSANGTFSLPPVPPGDYFLALRHMWLVDWMAPRQLDALARAGARVTAKAGEKVTMNLKR